MKTIDDYTISDTRALINDRDALVAMNAELVDVLKLADTSLKQVGFRDETFVIGSIKATLAKVKELNHEG